MNGTANTNGSLSGPLAGVRISLDPYTLDSSVGKRRLQAIEQDGSLVFGDPKTPETKLTERLERIWNEHPNGLLDLTEADLLAMPQNEPISQAEGDAGDKPVEEERYRGDLMTWEEMGKLRSEVFGQLNDARNELWFALELAKTLSVSGDFHTQPPVLPGQVGGPAKRGKGGPGGPDAKSTPASAVAGVPGVEPPVLPAGIFTTLPTTAPRKPLYREAYDLERALKAKQEALDDCSALIDAAVDELQYMAAAGEQFWDSIRTLRDGERGRGQWAIVPKPDFGRAMLAGEKAKDVVIPYAVDEAPAALIVRCLAAFDLDPSKEEALAFGARSHVRLRITLDDGISTTASRLVDAQVDSADVRAMMELVQLEAFEEEVFGEILGEASQMNGAVIEGRSVKLEYEGQRLTFELCDPRKEQGQAAVSSDAAELLLLSSKLLLSRLHRARKLRYLYPNRAPSALPSIVQPLLRILRFSATTTEVEATLELFASTLQSAGLESDVKRSFEGEKDRDTSALQGLMKGGEDLDVLSCTFRLKFEHSQGIALSLPVTRAARLQTSRAAVDLSHPADLASIVAEDLALQLAHAALPILQEELEDESVRDQVFLDELEGCIVAGRAGNISLSIPAPYDKVTARLEGGEAHVEAFVSGKGLTLREWLGGLAARMS